MYPAWIRLPVAVHGNPGDRVGKKSAQGRKGLYWRAIVVASGIPNGRTAPIGIRLQSHDTVVGSREERGASRGRASLASRVGSCCLRSSGICWVRDNTSPFIDNPAESRDSDSASRLANASLASAASRGGQRSSQLSMLTDPVIGVGGQRCCVG